MLQEADVALEKIYAQAESIKASPNAEQQLRELLKPLRDLIKEWDEEYQRTHVREEIKAHEYWQEAATRIQAMIKGKHQRNLLLKQNSFCLQGTKVTPIGPC
jgi:gas vesicle protein